MVLALQISSVAAQAKGGTPIDFGDARAAFAEAKSVSNSDGGRLWGKSLYGPMLLVDPDTRAVVANEADLQGVLTKSGDLFTGKLPESVIIADTPTEWVGKRWTMLRWPLPDDPHDRHVRFAHELFHRIQPFLHLNALDTPCLHLDSAPGRVWLELEWRALATALITSGPAQLEAIRDALAFRAHRRELFPGAASAERDLEIAEGVPEYTGDIIGSPDRSSARWRAVGKLAAPDLSMSFVRGFAYLSGPPYGLLLDDFAPDWRTKVNKQSDLGELLAAALPTGETVSAEKRAEVYGRASLQRVEDDRDKKAEAKKARYRALLVDGPTLRLPQAGHFAFSFNPSAVVSLDDAGAVQPTFHVSDDWGVLDVKDGALVPTDFSSVTVSAPTETSGSHLKGPGWTLDLAFGWRVVPAEKPGSFVVKKP